MDRLLTMFEHETIESYVLRNMQSQKDKTRHATLEEVKALINNMPERMDLDLVWGIKTDELLKAIEGLEK